MSKNITADKHLTTNPEFPRYNPVPWNRLPEIELYMDQVLMYVTRMFEPFWEYDGTTLTSSMINNYVKKKIMPAPRRKQYSKEHIASLIIILILKNIYSLEQINQILEPTVQKGEGYIATVYDWIQHCMAEGLQEEWPDSSDTNIMRIPEPPFNDSRLHVVRFGVLAFLSRQQGLYQLYKFNEYVSDNNENT